VLLVMFMLRIKRYALLLRIALRTVFRIVLAASLELWIVLRLGRMPRTVQKPLMPLLTGLIAMLTAL